MSSYPDTVTDLVIQTDRNDQRRHFTREQLNKMNVPSVLQPSAASVRQFRLELGLLLNIQRETVHFQ